VRGVFSHYRAYLRRRFLKDAGIAGVEYSWQAMAALLPLGFAILVASIFEVKGAALTWIACVAGVIALTLGAFITCQWLAVKDHEYSKSVRRNGMKRLKTLDMAGRKNG
jgi:CHASE2 domain-containing sensor protein